MTGRGCCAGTRSPVPHWPLLFTPSANTRPLSASEETRVILKETVTSITRNKKGV
jgi:hypothetical protein